jgi:hypothetical protein
VILNEKTPISTENCVEMGDFCAFEVDFDQFLVGLSVFSSNFCPNLGVFSAMERRKICGYRGRKGV